MGLTAAVGGMAVMSLANSSVQAGNEAAQQKYTNAIYGVNEKLAAENKRQVLAAGDVEAGQAALAGKQEIAQQRVHQAATGADVSSGSAANLQGDTLWQSEQNQTTIKNNAWRRAWGYDVEGEKYGLEASMSQLASANKQQNTLLTGGMQAVDYGMRAYSSYQKYNG